MSPSPSTMEMLEQLIASPSISSTHQHLDSSNLTVIHLLADWLESSGFAVNIDVVSNQPQKANLIARIGEDNNGLVLSGHTDTVPCDESLWNHDPFQLSQIENRYYGLGTADMKSFFAMVVSALKDINLKQLKQSLVVLATADEESTMSGAKHLLEHYSGFGKYCVIGEPTGLQPIRQHKGVFMESVTFEGSSGHSSNPALGNNALEGIHEAINVLLQYRDSLGKNYVNQDFAVPIPTLNLGHIHGGDNPNRICGQCELQYDLRLLPDMEIESVRNNLRDMIAEVANARDLQCTFKSLFDGTPALATPSDSEIVKLAEQISGKPSSAVTFATEGPYFSEMGMETIILGPGSINVAHQPNEFIEQAQIDQSILMYKRLIEKVCCA